MNNCRILNYWYWQLFESISCIYQNKCALLILKTSISFHISSDSIEANKDLSNKILKICIKSSLLKEFLAKIIELSFQSLRNHNKIHKRIKKFSQLVLQVLIYSIVRLMKAEVISYLIIWCSNTNACETQYKDFCATYMRMCLYNQNLI